MAGVELLSVIKNREAGVEEYIVLQQGFDEFILVFVVLEDVFIGDEISGRAIRFVGREQPTLRNHIAASIAHRTAHSVAQRIS